MSTSQLWAPKPQRPQQKAVERIDNAVPGTWLTLAPMPSPRANANFLQLTPTSSPLPSPNLKAAENGSPVELASLTLADSLPRPTAERYLSNNSTASRQSSVSSASMGPVSTRPPAFLTVPSVERREMAVRIGGLGAAFLSN